MTRFFRIAATAIAVAAAVPARAEMSAAEKAEIGGVVREYLLSNPEVLEEAMQALQQRRQQAQAEGQRKAVSDHSDLIFNSAHQVVVGNPQGPITLVEFFDYNCGYCRRAEPDLTALIDANPDLRVVIKELPILSEGSVTAARISVAVKDLAADRYLDFHRELFSRPGEASAEKALEVAKDLGLDVAALQAAAAKPAVNENLAESHQVAQILGISGTPSYVIGDEVVPGAVGFDRLQEKVAAMRTCGKTVC